MKLVSTRDQNNIVSFKDAVLHCVSKDGGLYVPLEMQDLRRWILYSNENTSFANLSGSLTSALINDEFSPIICETIATKAFSFEPVLKKLDEHLFVLELFHGNTGTYKDFGVSYLCSTLETILRYNDESAVLLDASTGELGACLASALKDKKLLKSVILFPKGKVRGIKDEDLVWNGGNIYPVEVDGTEEDCHNLVRAVFANNELVQKYNLTVANTTNIGRLFPQAFFYTYAFSRLKKIVSGDIYYALALGNYGNIVSGLYGWKLALPVNGFIVPCDENVKLDVHGRCTLLDSFVPLEQRTPCDPSDPSNLERLENIFAANSLMLPSFVFPAEITAEEEKEACKEMFVKYGYYADQDTSRAYAAVKKRNDILEDDEGTAVILSRNEPFIDRNFILHNLGECPSMSEKTQKAFEPTVLNRDPIASDDLESLISILNSVNLRRLF